MLVSLHHIKGIWFHHDLLLMILYFHLMCPWFNLPMVFFHSYWYLKNYRRVKIDIWIQIMILRTYEKLHSEFYCLRIWHHKRLHFPMKVAPFYFSTFICLFFIFKIIFARIVQITFLLNYSRVTWLPNAPLPLNTNKDILLLNHNITIKHKWTLLHLLPSNPQTQIQ